MIKVVELVHQLAEAEHEGQLEQADYLSHVVAVDESNGGLRTLVVKGVQLRYADNGELQVNLVLDAS